MLKTYDDLARYTTWMEQRIKEESLASPVSSKYDEENGNLLNDSMLPTWGKIVLS
jgi:hypothetical protein